MLINFNVTFHSVDSIQVLLLQEELVQKRGLNNIHMALNRISSDKGLPFPACAVLFHIFLLVSMLLFWRLLYHCNVQSSL